MRIEQLTFTRFIAAMAIVFLHFGQDLQIFSEKHIHKVLMQANLGVSYFFVLSGFVMVIASRNKSWINFKSFMVNCVARLYPVYIFALFCYFLYTLVEKNISVTPSEWMLNATLSQAWIPAKALSANFTGWSLSVEMLFYIAFPFLLNYFYRKYSFSVIIPVIIVFWLASQLFFLYGENSAEVFGFNGYEKHKFLYFFPLLHLNQFLVGNLGGLLYLKKLKNKSGRYDLHIIVLSAVIFAGVLLKPEFLSYHDGLLAPLVVLMILFFALNKGFITQIFSKKIPIYLGEISYSIYIMQIPVFGITQTILHHIGITSKLLTFAIGIFCILLVSSLIYRFIELPMRDKINKKFNK